MGVEVSMTDTRIIYRRRTEVKITCMSRWRDDEGQDRYISGTRRMHNVWKSKEGY